MISYNVLMIIIVILLLPLQFFLPIYVLFILVCIGTMQILTEYLNDMCVYLITGVAVLMIMMQSISPNYLVLYITALVLLLLLLKYLIPSKYLLLTVDVIVTVIILQLFLPSFLLLVIGVAIIYAMLRNEYADYRNKFVCYFLYAAYMSSVFVVSIIMLPVVSMNPMDVHNIVLASYFAHPISSLLGIKWEIKNPQNMGSNNKGAVIVSNHQTVFDILGMGYLIHELNVKTTAVAQKLIFWAWPFGLDLWLSKVIFVSRKPETEESIADLIDQTKPYCEDNIKIWFFPEGEFNATSTLVPFRKEAFKVAITHKVPIIPVVFSPYYFVNWEEKRFESGTMTIEVLPPVETEKVAMDTIDQTIQSIYQNMSNKYSELSNRSNTAN